MWLHMSNIVCLLLAAEQRMTIVAPFRPTPINHECVCVSVGVHVLLRKHARNTRCEVKEPVNTSN